MQQIGSYQLIDVIGRGGTATVYRARHSILDSEVAVKMLRDEYQYTPELRERFVLEAKVAHSLRHPGIARVYHFEMDDEGRCYSVMELLDGPTLADELARGPLAVARVIEVGIQLAEALREAHRNGVIHRDLKPENVVQTPEGLKLIDFGIAARAGSAAGDYLVGTPQSMAPEQIAGEPLDEGVDVYGLGVLLYQCLTGRLPFDAHSLRELWVSVVSDPPPPLPEWVPDGLRCLIERCLAKSAEERPRDMDEIVLHLSEQRAVLRDDFAAPTRSPRASSGTRVAARVASGTIECAPATPAMVEALPRGWQFALTAWVAVIVCMGLGRAVLLASL